MAGMLGDIVVGSAAGLAATEVMDRVSTAMYERTRRTHPEAIRREEELEPRGPGVVLAQKLESRLGLDLDQKQEQRMASVFHYGTGITAGVAYMAFARRSSLGWFTGGLVFGTAFWAIFDEMISPAMGLVGDNRKYPTEAHVRGLVAHVAFGVVAAGIGRAISARWGEPADHRAGSR